MRETYTSDIQQAFNGYQAMLQLPTGVSIPDPLKIKNGWISEQEDGMKLWPQICIADIINHFNEQNINTKQLLSDYKDKKAFDYSNPGWLKEISYHSMAEVGSSNTGFDMLCLLKAKCT